MVKATDLDPEFIERPIMEQLGKIVDSETLREVVRANKFNPVNKVLTDDGKEYMISAGQANRLMNFVTEMRMPYRYNVIRNIQNSNGFENLCKLVLK